KLMHYMARRFYLPVNVVAVPVHDAVAANSRGIPLENAPPDRIVLRGINDTAAALKITLEVRAIRVTGGERMLFSGQGHLGPDAAIPLAEIAFADLAADEFLFCSWRDGDGRLLSENDYFPRPYKAYDLPLPSVTGQWADRDGQPVLTLETDKPAL